MMMTSLFSIFDPSSFIFSLNWISLFLFSTFFFSSFWVIPSNYGNTINMVISLISKEVKTTLSSKTPMGSSLFLSSMFVFIFWNNFLGLLPYIFTSSSHMSLTFSLALPFWMSLILFSWLNYVINSFAHLVPQGTPFALMMFMVLIESISQIIRPLTLAVRLMANMIAGHLLMTLVGNMAASSFFITFLGSMNAFLMLSVLEIAVSMIQAYVFVILMTLYVMEANDH